MNKQYSNIRFSVEAEKNGSHFLQVIRIYREIKILPPKSTWIKLLVVCTQICSYLLYLNTSLVYHTPIFNAVLAFSKFDRELEKFKFWKKIINKVNFKSLNTIFKHTAKAVVSKKELSKLKLSC